MDGTEGPAWVVLADGDDIGRILDMLAANNDQVGFIQESKALDDDREALATWFEEHGATILLSASDTILASGSGAMPVRSLLPSLRATWSVGIGRDISGAQAALAVAKALGRNQWVDGSQWNVGGSSEAKSSY